jgi:nucleotide-binding universal stress UspA family protein
MSRPLNSRILFVWDGSDKFIKSAESFAQLIEDRSIYAIHAMPHESIYNYNSVISRPAPKPQPAQDLEAQFRKQVSRTKALKEAKFEILFGDRVNEILISAAQLQAKYIAMPRFKQSNFSRWMHGDLNEKITKKATCPVIFLDEEPDSIPSVDVSAGYHQEQS